MKTITMMNQSQLRTTPKSNKTPMKMAPRIAPTQEQPTSQLNHHRSVK
jgi:hypothetical protein